MIVSTVVSAVAFSTIIVVAIVLANQTKDARDQVELKLNHVVDQVNTAQQYSYEFDKRQQQQVIGLERNVDDVRVSYLEKDALINNVTTKQLNANTMIGNNVSLNGAIQFNSTLAEAYASPNYVIQRGADTKDPNSKNQLIIKTPAQSGAAVNIMTSDGQSRMKVDSKTGEVTVPANIRTNSLQLGNKFKLSGVGDSMADDGWLRQLDANGKDYSGGFATANLYSRDNTYLNGNTFASAPVKIRYNAVGNWTDKAAIAAWTPDGNHAGPSFGGPDNWSHFPWFDGNTYIRPGKRGGDINVDNANIARLGANRIELNGQVFTPNGVNINNSDPGPLIEKNYGSPGDRYGVGQFPGGQTKLYAATNYPGKVSMSLAKEDGNFDDIITVNPDRSTHITGPLKMRHNWGDWTNRAAISVWTPDENHIGPSFGGPNHWSQFPGEDGNTYIRSGKNNGSINIGDINGMNVNLGNNVGTVTVQGTINTPKGIKINNSDPGPLIEKNYGSPGDRYGIGQFPGGQTKLYAATNYPGKVSMSLAKEDGNFDDIITVNPDRSTHITGPLKMRHNWGDWTNQAPITTWTPDGNHIGPSFGGPNNWSHFPWKDGNTYIRPGKANGNILVGDTSTSYLQLGDVSGKTTIQLGPASLLPHADGNSYIRPGRNGGNVLIGDAMAAQVRIGKEDGSGPVYLRANNTFVKNNIDASDDQGGNNGKALYAGWASDKVVLGNNSSGGQDYINSLPKNTVATANDLHVNGKLYATNNLCIGNSCLNEADILLIKSQLGS